MDGAVARRGSPWAYRQLTHLRGSETRMDQSRCETGGTGYEALSYVLEVF